MNSLYTYLMIDDTQTMDNRVAIGISAVGILIAIMITVQLSVNVISPSYYTPAIIFAFVSNLVVIPLLLFLATRRKAFILPTLAWVHFSMSVMIIYFSQTYSPFTASWSILILISSIYYRWKGFIASSTALAITGAAYIILFPQNVQPVLNYTFLSILVVALTIFSSYLFVNVIMTIKRKNYELGKAEQSEMLQVTRLNTLLNSISDAVMTLNRYGRVTSQNAAAQAFFDTNESLIGKDIDKLLIVHDQANAQISIHTLIKEVKSTTFRDDLSYGEISDIRRLSVQLSRIRSTFDDSEEYGVVIIIRDITKQKTLEDEKDEFISVTSHELRTPVAIAEGSISNLALMYERNMEHKKLVEATKTAHEQIMYLAKMINDLSTLSRAERGVGDTVEVLETDVLVNDLYNRYQSEAEEKGLQLNLDADSRLPQIKTSKLYLEEILQNFITNAIKYTKEGSVTIRVKRLEGNKIEFAVSDTGIGISKPDKERIFEKFYRSEDYRTRETNGTGLGLYVVRKLAAKLGVTIKVESRLNFGSTFSFVMNAYTEGSDAKEPQQEAKEPVAVN